MSNVLGDPNQCDQCYNGTVSVIDTATNTVVTSIPLGDPSYGSAPYGVAFSPDGTHAYVADSYLGTVNNVYVIDTATNSVINTIPMPGSSRGIAFPPPASVPYSGTTCNGTYTGTFKGNINVSAGQNCSFVRGGVTGNIVVTGGNFSFANGLIGGSVGIAGASTFTLGPGTTINGSLGIGLVARGTTTNQVCGVKVLHDFGVAGAASPLQIGLASRASCAGNIIGGNASIDGNAAAIAVYGNSVTGTLSCLANNAITGGGNTAKKKLGQCAAF